jgi:hypothetical protein
MLLNYVWRYCMYYENPYQHNERNLREAQLSVIQWVLDLFPGVRWLVCVIDHRPPSSSVVKERVELYLYAPLWALMVCSRLTVTFVSVCKQVIEPPQLILIPYYIMPRRLYTFCSVI